MQSAVVLVVSQDSSLLGSQNPVWKSPGYFVTTTRSIREALDSFRSGDFDLVLLDQSVPVESRERLTFLIRASGSRVPVVCITDSSTECDAFADATIRKEPSQLLQGIGEMLAKNANPSAGNVALHHSVR